MSHLSKERREQHADQTPRNRQSEPRSHIIFTEFGHRKNFQNLLLTDHQLAIKILGEKLFFRCRVFP